MSECIVRRSASRKRAVPWWVTSTNPAAARHTLRGLTKRATRERLRQDRDDKDRLIRGVEEWLEEQEKGPCSAVPPQQ